MRYTKGVLQLIFTLWACEPRVPETCRDRADDADCDGVRDAIDRCPETPFETAKDAAGCSENQAAGCSVELLAPEDGQVLSGQTRFAWNGTCDRYLLQFSDEPTFPAAATRTATRTEATEVLAVGRERYWRVVGGLEGSPNGATGGPRQLGWSE